MLELNKKAPNFTLPDKDGNQISLSDFLGKKVVLYFYPRDNTPGCTRQACAFGEVQNGKVVEKGTMCKMARGEMVRFLAETKAKNLADVKKFNRSGYQFSTDYSTENIYTFIKGEF